MEFLAASAPKDGTTIATVPSGPLIEPLVGTRAKPTPMTAFNALGAWANDFSLCASWHASGFNTSSEDRLAINHMFTRSYMKQMIDYVRALGDEFVLGLPPRTQQLLGWYTRVVTGNDEYYRPPDERLYRAEQG